MTAPGSNHNRSLAALAAIALVGLCLRLAGLDHQSFWIDEIASLQLAQDGFVEGFQRVRSDVHPPGYFVLLHLWIARVGSSESAVRWLSVIPSVLTIAALFRLGRVLFREETGVRIGLMAAAIAAGSLSQIYYAQEARSYAWLMLLATLSMDAVARLTTRHRAIDWIAYALTTTALLYTHYFGFFAVAAQNAFVLYRWWGAARRDEHRGSLAGWLLTQGAIGLAFVPWLPSLVAQTAAVRSGFWIGEASLAGLGTSFLRLASLAGPWSRGGPPGYFAWLAPLVAAAAVGGAVAGAAIALRRARVRRNAPAVRSVPGTRSDDPSDAAVLLGLWLLVPPLAGWSLSLFGLDVFTYRNTMISAPAAALLLAVACDRLSRPSWKVAAVLAVWAPSIAQAPAYYSQPHKDQWREAARRVESGFVASSDGIAFDAPFVRSSLLHYSPRLREALGSSTGVDVLAESPPDHSRIWLVRAYAGPRSRSPERIAGWGYAEVARSELVAIEIVFFERTPHP